MKRNYYIGRHEEIFSKRPSPPNKPDNRLVFNLAKKLVSTFNGYFSGEPVSIKHQNPDSQTDDDVVNDKIQEWLSKNDYGDVFSEWAKQADIYGRSYLYVYPKDILSDDKNKAVGEELKLAVCSPRDTLVVYDDSIEHNPMFAVRYSTNSTGYSGTLITTDRVYLFDPQTLSDAGNVTKDATSSLKEDRVLKYPALPIIELPEDSERSGLFDDSINLIDAINNVMSSKGNDNDIFNESYLVIIGDQLDKDQVTMLQDSHIINIYPKKTGIPGQKDNSVTPNAFFLSPDPHDEAKENFLNRAIDMVYQASQVVNLNDSSFGMSAQSISGVALLQRYQPMQARAKVKSHKMDKALRQMFTIMFDKMSLKADPENLTFDHKQSIPHNALEEAQTVQILNGQVSDVTKLSYLSSIDDPAKEVERLKTENEENAKEVKLQNEQYLNDQQKKAGVTNVDPNSSTGAAKDPAVDQPGQPDGRPK